MGRVLCTKRVQKACGIFKMRALILYFIPNAQNFNQVDQVTCLKKREYDMFITLWCLS